MCDTHCVSEGVGEEVTERCVCLRSREGGRFSETVTGALPLPSNPVTSTLQIILTRPPLAFSSPSLSMPPAVVRDTHTPQTAGHPHRCAWACTEHWTGTDNPVHMAVQTRRLWQSAPPFLESVGSIMSDVDPVSDMAGRKGSQGKVVGQWRGVSAGGSDEGAMECAGDKAARCVSE